jgi:diguanylate cyclase (GGDEF)-like protein
VFRRLGRIIRTSIFILGGATALLYAGLGLLSFSLVSGLDDLERENRVLAAGGALYSGLIRYDTGLRGYAITGDARYLELQRQAHAEILAQVQNLTSLAAARKNQLEKVHTIEQHLQHRFRHSEALIALRNYSPALPENTLENHVVESEKSYEAINQLLGEMSKEASRSQHLRAERRKEFLWTFWVILGLGGVVLLGSTIYFWDQTHRLVHLGERSAEETDEAAHHDALTGLPNRRLLDKRVDAALSHPSPTRQLALLMLDLDGFKAVNDGVGHAAGDELLKEVGQRLRDAVRTRDLVVRLGGDEFVVFIEKLEDKAEVREVAARILTAVAEPFDIAGETIRIGVSIGICFATSDYVTLSTMLRHADKALYAAKRAGKGCTREYAFGIENGVPHRP